MRALCRPMAYIYCLWKLIIVSFVGSVSKTGDVHAHRTHFPRASCADPACVRTDWMLIGDTPMDESSTCKDGVDAF